MCVRSCGPRGAWEKKEQIPVIILITIWNILAWFNTLPEKLCEIYVFLMNLWIHRLIHILFSYIIFNRANIISLSDFPQKNIYITRFLAVLSIKSRLLFEFLFYSWIYSYLRTKNVSTEKVPYNTAKNVVLLRISRR